MHENEIARAFKTVNDTYIEPISFIVPRRAESFQDDIYPPATGLKPAMSASEWLSGKEAIPPKISLGSLYEGEGEKEVLGVQDKPTSTLGTETKPEPKPESKPAPKAEPEAKPASPVKKAPEPVSEPTVVAKPAPSMKDQGASMSAMVNKFADDDEPEPAPESNFDEPSKPVERATGSPGTSSPTVKVSPPAVSHSIPQQVVFSNRQTQASPTVDRSPGPGTPTAQPSSPLASTSGSVPAASVAPDTMSREFGTIKDLIAEQNKLISSQAQQVQSLTSEIESLKAKLG